MKDRGVKRDNAGNYPLIARVRADAVLVEYGFVTNSGDNALFDANLSAMAKATAEAVQEVYGVQGESAPSSTPAPATPNPPTSPSPAATTYKVAKGDTMTWIAKKLGVTLAALIAANPQVKNPTG